MIEPKNTSNLRAASPRTRAAGEGFTLVEIMVATAVLALLLVSLVQVASAVADTWSTGHSRAERRQHGRAIVDFIGRELRSAALPVHRAVFSDKADLQFVLNPTSLSGDLKNPHALFWQAPVATDTSQGALAQVGYFVHWDGNMPMLCRMFINPGSSDYLIYDANKIGSWMNAGIANSATPAVQNGWVGLFAEDVVGFWARCLDRNGQPIVQNGGGGLYDSRAPYSSTVDGVTTAYDAPVLPFCVEVSIVTVDSRATAGFDASTRMAVMEMVKSPGTLNAAAFIEALKTKAETRKDLLPVLRSAVPYQIQVYLENSP